MVQFIGQDEQPWSFASDQGGGLKDNKRLVDLVQKLIDVFWPEQSYEVTGGDKIYRIVSILPFCYRARADNVSLQAYQAVVDWRTRFHTRIKVHIKKELEMRFKTVKLRGQWVESALKLAFWEAYNAEVCHSVPLVQHSSSRIEKEDRGVGALQLPYILMSFVHHLTAIQGSRVPEDDVLPACGALALLRLW